MANNPLPTIAPKKFRFFTYAMYAIQFQKLGAVMKIFVSVIFSMFLISCGQDEKNDNVQDNRVETKTEKKSVQSGFGVVRGQERADCHKEYGVNIKRIKRNNKIDEEEKEERKTKAKRRLRKCLGKRN